MSGHVIVTNKKIKYTQHLFTNSKYMDEHTFLLGLYQDLDGNTDPNVKNYIRLLVNQIEGN